MPFPRPLEELQAEFARLNDEIAALRDHERAKVLAHTRETVKFYELKPSDIFTNGRPAKKKPPRKNRRGVARYVNDKGDTWSGFARKPKWVVEHLEAGGKLEDLEKR